MRAAIQKSAVPATQMFVVRYLNEKVFDPVWHAHSEYQLFVVLEGTGTRFIGDNIHSFKPGELILTGPHLPHLWRSRENYFRSNSELETKGIVVYLDQHFLGENMLDKTELYRLKLLFERSKRGLEFHGQNKQLVIELMKGLVTMEGIQSLMQLLQILHILSATNEFEFISSRPCNDLIKEPESDRLNKVYKHILTNYRNKIPLERMADLLHMTPSSFSRYFTMKNNKTYSRFLMEIRIKHACELLNESDMTVAEICYECGFNTLSNFNKIFKEVTHRKPTEYKKEFMNLYASRSI